METLSASMDATNDTINAQWSFLGGGVSPTARISSLALRFVLRDNAGWHVSEPTTYVSGSAFSLEATELAYFGYDPTNSIVAIGTSETPSFNEIDWVGFQVDATRGPNTGGANAGLRKFSVQAFPGSLETAFVQWANSFLLSGTNALVSADPDGDRLNNLYEFGLGGNPTNGNDTGISPTYAVVAQSGTNGFQYVYPRRTGDSGLHYALELNPDLVSGSWSNIGTSAETGSGTLDVDFESVTNRISTAGMEKEFIRLIIEQTP